MSRMTTSRKGRGVFAVVVLMLVVSILGTACAPGGEAWPTKQVTLVNPFARGRRRRRPGPQVRGDHVQDAGPAHGGARTPPAPAAPRPTTKSSRPRPTVTTLIWYSGAINTLAATKQIPFNYTAFEPVCGIGAETVAIAVQEGRALEGFQRVHRLRQGQPRQGHHRQLRRRQRDPHGARGHGQRGQGRAHPRSVRHRPGSGLAARRQDLGLQPASRRDPRPGQVR